MSQLYVGCKAGAGREVFRSNVTPTEESHGKMFAMVIGPFRTLRGARWMAHPIRGTHNPHCVTVADAERLAKIYKSDYNPETGWSDPQAYATARKS